MPSACAGFIVHLPVLMLPVHVALALLIPMFASSLAGRARGARS